MLGRPPRSSESTCAADEVSGFRIFIVDTSAVVRLKTVPVAEQWATLQLLVSLVQQGRMGFPKQVVQEGVDRAQHPDAPGAWLAHVAPFQQHPEPESVTLRRVLEAATLVEVTADHDVADPYVVAMALELKDEGFDVVLVTHDKVDRLPVKESIATACDRLDIVHCELDAFLEWALSPTKLSAAPIVPAQEEIAEDAKTRIRREED